MSSPLSAILAYPAAPAISLSVNISSPLAVMSSSLEDEGE